MQRPIFIAFNLIACFSRANSLQTDTVTLNIDNDIVAEISESMGTIAEENASQEPHTFETRVEAIGEIPKRFTSDTSFTDSTFSEMEEDGVDMTSSDFHMIRSSISKQPSIIISSIPTESPTSIVKSTSTGSPTSMVTTASTHSPTPIASTESTDSSTAEIETSEIPSSFPSLTASSEPTNDFSDSPSDSPTFYSSSSPSYERPKTYWNYDPMSKFGPQNWEKVGDGEEIFQKMTGGTSNKCEKGDKQSPIVLDPNSSCRDDHQTHTQRGNKNFDEIEFEVLPHALRALMPKNSGSGNRAPRADFSNLSGLIPATYMDVKIPSEHQINGEDGLPKAFPGEIQIAHDWGSKVVNIAFFIDHEEDKHNEQFEDFILKWEDFHLDRLNECANRDKKVAVSYIPKFRKRSLQEMELLWGDKDDWPGSADYDLYRLMPTVYYYGYEGSSTSPPCGSRVYWRVQDIPMQISRDQYTRMQSIILDQKDENCKRSSKAYHGGVNRPIQKTTQKVWYCGSHDWFVRHPDKWCEKWPEEYHGRFRIDRDCNRN